MISNSKYHKNYTELGATYQLVLPLSLEEIRWEMGRKDVSKNTGCGQPIEPGLYAVFLCIKRKSGTGETA